jgi:hypothetical protein
MVGIIWEMLVAEPDVIGPVREGSDDIRVIILPPQRCNPAEYNEAEVSQTQTL